MVHHNVSEGARLLIAAGSIDDTATRLGVSKRAISAYRAGRRPADGIQQRMHELLSIPPAAWQQQAGTAGIAKAAAKLNGDSPAVAAPAQPLAPPVDENAVQRLRAQCARLKATREAGNLTPRALVEIEQLELRSSALLAKLTSHAITTAQILASQPWEEMWERMNAALTEHDQFAIWILGEALDEDSPAGREAMQRLRHGHPAEVAACEAANKKLSDALAAYRAGRAA